MATEVKYVYTFGDGKAEGNASMKNLLGGKGANLAEMSLLKIPVPPGLTITTEACNLYSSRGWDYIKPLLEQQVREGVAFVENAMGKKFGDPKNPLLLSVRSGARASMPGMMDTILNLGLNDEILEGLIKLSGEDRFAWDSYRRFIQMYGDVVMGLKPINKEDEDPFEVIIDELKEERKIKMDIDLTAADFKELASRFKKLITTRLNRPFPTDPWDQLWNAILAVFNSWNNDRAKVYRSLNNIPESWGTAVNIQSMVFGNLSHNSATGVAFTRDAGTGEDLFNGEFLFNAQGEDVVAGIRTPQQITKIGSQRWAELARVDEATRVKDFPSLEEVMPEVYEQLHRVESSLETHYRDMQDIEFTIQEGKLWMLQTRNGKRTGTAMVKIAMDMLKQGLIDEHTALNRIDPARLDEVLHPVFEKSEMKKAKLMARGLPASPGAASGQIVFFADEAEEWAKKGKEVILVRTETSPEDLRGMSVAKGILTARGGMTSHAAVVARGMGKCCISGAGALKINYYERTLTVDGKVYKEGDWISLNGSTGEVYEGHLKPREFELSKDFADLMHLADEHTRLQVRTNADTPEEAAIARKFGAKGIGLCRTEHMFFEGDRIKAVREMILAKTESGRRAALAKLLPIQRQDFEGIFREMHDLPVTIRLLDPPLHEFVPNEEENQKEMAKEMGVTYQDIHDRVEELKEANPMLGHRGCRLGITYPEITEMQVRAIIEAAINVRREHQAVIPEIMIPLVGTVKEFTEQEKIIRRTAETVFKEMGERIAFHIGTMIETPRAAFVADQISTKADFFSFGTNDLTQMTFGFSRDDAAKFLPDYINKGILDHDPFKQIDQGGVGQVVEMAIKKGRDANKMIHLGVCGEHGGDPSSVAFFHKAGLDYVSCSPYRVPIARLAAAQAKIKYGFQH